MKRLVLKIGGSLLYNDELQFNTNVVKKIIQWQKIQTDYEQLVFVVGGGKISRFVVNQVKQDIPQDFFRHRTGMKMTQVNASIFHGMMDDPQAIYFEDLNNLFHEIKEANVKTAVIGGTKVGASTDMVAAEIALNLDVEVVYKISNITNIYSNDPNLDTNAIPLNELSWDEYVKLFEQIFEKGHKPGMNIPIDFRCASFCRENRIGFRVTGGKNLDDMDICELLKTGTLVK